MAVFALGRLRNLLGAGYVIAYGSENTIYWGRFLALGRFGDAIKIEAVSCAGDCVIFWGRVLL